MRNYATKTDLKNVKHEDVSIFASKTNLAGLKAEVEKLDIDKLTPVPSSALTAVENKIPNVSNLVKKTDYNTKISEIE